MPSRDEYNYDDRQVGDWNRHKLLVLQDIERLDDTISQHAEKHEKAFEQIKQSVVQLRMDMLSSFTALQHSITSSHTLQYNAMEERVRDIEANVGSMRGWSAGIAGTVSLLIAILGLIAAIYIH